MRLPVSLRGSLLLFGIAVLGLLVSGCSRSLDADTAAGASTFDPLTVSIPDSPLDPLTPPEPGVLRIAGTPSSGLGLLRVAGAEGLFAAQGLPAAIDAEPDEDAVARVLAAGDADAAVVSTEQALQLDEAGAPIRIVLLLTSSKTADVLVAVDGVDGVEGLVGRRVAYAPGGDGELALRAALEQIELGFDDVVAVPVADAAEAASALATGAVDAALVGEAQERELMDAVDGLQRLWAAGEQPGVISRVVAVREDVARERPGQMLALVRAWQEMYLLDRDDPERIGARTGTIQGGSGEEALRMLEATSIYDVPQNAVELFPGGEYHDAVIGRVAALAAEAGWIEPMADPQALIDGVFAQTVASAG